MTVITCISITTLNVNRLIQSKYKGEQIELKKKKATTAKTRPIYAAYKIINLELKTQK